MRTFQHLSPPRTGLPAPVAAHPLLAALGQKRQGDQPTLSDYPDLAIAATATKADLDIESDTFGSVQACLETLARLRLSASSTWLLMLLAKHGPQNHTALAARMKKSSSAMTGLITRLEALGLVTTSRKSLTDCRSVLITPTEAARKVLASVMALTGLGGAAAVLLKQKPVHESRP